jgi:hypothetical protein
MKKRLFLPVLCVSLFISAGAMTRDFWDLYVSGPETRSMLSPDGFGVWTIEDTYEEPVDPNNQYEWFVMDFEAIQSGYPTSTHPVGRPAYDIDRECTASLTWGEGYEYVSEVTLTCKITNGSNVRYESIVIVDDTEE